MHPGKEGCPVPKLLGSALITLNWNKQFGKQESYLFSLIFLKHTDSSHLFPGFILEVFPVFIWNFCGVFVTRNILQELISCLY